MGLDPGNEHTRETSGGGKRGAYIRQTNPTRLYLSRPFHVKLLRSSGISSQSCTGIAPLAIPKMGKRQWPVVSSDYPDSILDHAGCLHDELEAMNNYARESQSSKVVNSRLPRTLRKKITNGITAGIQDAMATGALKKDLSAKKQARIRDTIGRHITEEAGHEARDRIPLDLFTCLLDSYSELIIKLWDSPAFRSQPEEPGPGSLSHASTQSESSSQSEDLDYEILETPSEEDSDINSDARDLMEGFKKTEREPTVLMHKIGTMQGGLGETGSKNQEGEVWEDGEEEFLEDGSDEANGQGHEDFTEEEEEEGSDGLHNYEERGQEEIEKDKAEQPETGMPRETSINADSENAEYGTATVGDSDMNEGTSHPELLDGARPRRNYEVIKIDQPTDIKVEPRTPPRRQDQVDLTHAIEDLQKMLIEKNEALLKLRGQMVSFKKRSSGEAFPKPDLSQHGGDGKRARQDV